MQSSKRKRKAQINNTNRSIQHVKSLELHEEDEEIKMDQEQQQEEPSGSSNSLDNEGEGLESESKEEKIDNNNRKKKGEENKNKGYLQELKAVSALGHMQVCFYPFSHINNYLTRKQEEDLVLSSNLFRLQV